MRTRKKAQKAELRLNRHSSICLIEGKCHPRRCDRTNAGSELKPTLSIPPSDKKAALYKRTLANPYYSPNNKPEFRSCNSTSPRREPNSIDLAMGAELKTQLSVIFGMVPVGFR